MPPIRFKNFPSGLIDPAFQEFFLDCLKTIERTFVDLGFADSFRKDEYQDWKPWSPGPRGSGTMKLVVTKLWHADFRVVGSSVDFNTTFDFTTVGTGTTDIFVKLPLPFAWPVTGFQGFYADGGFDSLLVRSYGEDEILITRRDVANWGIGAGKRIAVWGTYRRA